MRFLQFFLLAIINIFGLTVDMDPIPRIPLRVGDHQFFAKIVYGQTIHVHKMIGLCAH